LGPGEFLTRGNASQIPNIGWTIQEGWKIVGSGIDVTTLKVVGATDKVNNASGTNVATFLYLGIGQRFYDQRADYAEVSDLTVDCNLPGSPGVAIGAVGLSGSHTRIRRVRSINFGTQHPDVECFVLVAGGGHGALPEMVDCLIEDCIVEQPSENNVRETTCLLVQSGEDPTDGIMGYVRAGVLRNNFINCEYANGNVTEVQSIDFGDGGGGFGQIGTLTTQSPHRHILGKNLVLQGATNASGTNPFNGVFPIEEIVSDSVLKYRMENAPTENPTGTMRVGGAISSHWVKIVDITLVAGTTKTYRVTTDTPHQRTVSNNVVVSGVIIGGSSQNAFNGSYSIDRILYNGNLEPLEFEYTLSQVETGTLNLTQAYINPPFQGLSNGGLAAVIEDNKVVGCRIGGPYHDFWSQRVEIIRRNHYHDVHMGPRQNMGGRSLLKVGSSLVRDGSVPTVAIFTTTHDHGLLDGEGVLISEAKIGGDPEPLYNGEFEIKVLSADSFSYQMQGDPGNSADAGARFAAIWQVGLLLVEDNLLELLKDRKIGTLPPVAISFADELEREGPYVFRKGIIRGNVIRQINGLHEADLFAVSITGFEKAIIENNTIDLANPNPIRYYKCGQVYYFNNQTPGGQLILGVDRTSGSEIKQPELSRFVEDATVLSI